MPPLYVGVFCFKVNGKGDLMKIDVGNKTITSVDFSNNEIAWKIEDTHFVLDYFRKENKIILGGDILTKNLVHNYDSWYYNYDQCQSEKSNVESGYKSAIEYISKYIQLNGNDFYVIIVTK